MLILQKRYSLPTRVIRLFFYLLIAVIYLNHMQSSSSLGITALDFQFQRVLNACLNILSNAPFFKFGLTSWITYEESSSSYYFVQAISYIHYLPALIVGGEEGLRKAMSFLDPLIVIGCSGLSAEIYYALNKPLIKSKFQSIY